MNTSTKVWLWVAGTLTAGLVPNTPPMTITGVQDFGPAGTGAGADPAMRLVQPAA